MDFKDDFRQLSALVSEGVQADWRLLLVSQDSNNAYLVPKTLTQSGNRDKIRAWVLAHGPNTHSFLISDGERLLPNQFKQLAA